MPITINTNLSAMISQRNLGSAATRSASSLSKLSSGSRVPTAKEDAASLAVGTGLSVEVSALRAAQVNAQQASSLLQIADGAFSQVSDILTRMKSLATTAQSGQLSGTERGYLNDEYGLLRQEIDRISATTEFNGQALLGGSNTLAVDVVDVNQATGTATAILPDDGFVAVEFDASQVTAGDQFAVFYDDSTGNITVNNVTQGNAQTIALGSNVDPVQTGGTRELDFASIGVSITINNDFNTGLNVGAGAGADIGTLATLDGSDATVVFGAVAGTTAAAASFDFQVGSGNSITDTNNSISITIAQGDFSSLIGGGAGSDLTLASNAAAASDEIDAAVGGVNTARAGIGSSQNRIEFAQNNLAVTIENSEAARSVLLDVDVSMEITKFTSEQVLIQAGVSMLAQANQQPSLLLRLLQ
jgi:flagellin